MSDQSAGVVALATVSRDGVIESTHFGRVAICQNDGRLLASAGDPDAVQFWRSASKPIQALSVVTSGAADRFEFTQKELSVCCASHSGSAEHVETVSGILAKLGLDETDLNCGAHWPGDTEERNRLIRAGQEPGQLHNNCSGKHAGMLATALALGAPTEGYLEFDHPVQQMIAINLSLLANFPVDNFAPGRDGCGAPTAAMPLAAMARAFARLADHRELSDDLPDAASRICDAMAAEPVMVSSRGSFNTELLRLGGGDIVAKGGAEGLFCMASRSRGISIAVKCSDGSGRPHPPAVIALMRKAKIDVPAELAERFERVPVTNCHRDTVGHVEAVEMALEQWA
ncbi:MAG: asparaginase [Armatimonadota bacterium]|jgi:L-asparaginase II